MINLNQLDHITIQPHVFRTLKHNEIPNTSYMDEVKIGLINRDSAWEYVSELIADVMQYKPYRFKIDRYTSQSQYFGTGVQEASDIWNLSLGHSKAKCMVSIYYNNNLNDCVGAVFNLPDYENPWNYERCDIKAYFEYFYKTELESSIKRYLSKLNKV